MNEQKNLSKLETRIPSGPRLIVFSAGCDCVSYVRRHLRSIRRQSYKNYVHVVVDDASVDNTNGIIKDHENPQMVIHRNTKNLKWVHNAWKYIPQHIRSDEDVIVLVDLDDWLATKRALSVIANTYEREKCWVTYGSFVFRTGGILSKKPRKPIYSEKVVAEHLFRKVSWKWWHPKTFKAFLWKNLRKEDLYGPDGRFPPYSYDKAIGFPILEMTPPDKLVYIPEVLYVYNVDNPKRSTKLKKGNGLGRWYRGKRPYKVLERE